MKVPERETDLLFRFEACEFAKCSICGQNLLLAYAQHVRNQLLDPETH